MRLIHWKAAEAASLIAMLKRARHTVDYDEKVDQRLLLTLRDAPPDALVIHLGRIPSHGRSVGVWLRQNKSTRAIPLVFLDGEPAKVDRVRDVLPDAIYTTSAALLRDLPPAGQKVDAAPPRLSPEHARPLAQKLGLRPGLRVQVIDAPGGLGAMLGELPAGLEFTEEPTAFTLAFQYDAEGFRASLPALRRAAARGKLWIAWRKQGARRHDAELTAPVIRELAARVGLVDYKICSLGADWSAMAFSRKKEPAK